MADYVPPPSIYIRGMGPINMDNTIANEIKEQIERLADLIEQIMAVNGWD